MNDGFLLSVVVPVYNTAPYLKKCVDSILGQTYGNLEIILVDDGSTDGSSTLCDAYEAEFGQVKVIHKENGGLLSARKRGLAAAGGEYVAFVDSDDWIEADLYQKLSDLAGSSGVDMVTSGLLFEWPDRKRVALDLFAEGNYGRKDIEGEILPQMAYHSSLHRQGIIASVSNKLLKTSLLKQVMAQVDEGMTLGEDGAVVYSLLAKASKITVTHVCGYHYVQREGSMLHDFGVGSFEKIYRLQSFLERSLQNSDPQVQHSLNGQISKFVSPFLKDAVRAVFKQEMIVYMFPYERVAAGSRIALYGAGDVGKSYWKCLYHGGYAEVTVWVDKNSRVFADGTKVEKPEALLHYVYDYIVIAVFDEYTAKQIMDDLRRIDAGIHMDQMIWSAPVYVG